MPAYRGCPRSTGSECWPAQWQRRRREPESPGRASESPSSSTPFGKGLSCEAHQASLIPEPFPKRVQKIARSALVTAAESRRRGRDQSSLLESHHHRVGADERRHRGGGEARL